MVDKNELRAAFASRLHESLNDAGIRSRGRGVDVQKQLKSVGVSKTTQAISKWLNGEAIAEADSMVALSAWLHVRREWLEYGVLPKTHEGASGEHTSSAANAMTAKPSIKRFSDVPLISWVKAASSHPAALEAESAENGSWLPCPVPISKSGYALLVRGDSMTNPGSGRSYPAGCIIFVDPELATKPGDRVVAQLPHTNEVTFKVLAEDAGRQFLRPINPQYPIIEISEGTHICGKVVGAFLPE